MALAAMKFRVNKQYKQLSKQVKTKKIHKQLKQIETDIMLGQAKRLTIAKRIHS